MSSREIKLRDKRTFNNISENISNDELKDKLKPADMHFRLRVFEESVTLLAGSGSVVSKVILDFGCGPAAYSTWLARTGARVVCLDLSSGMLAKGRERAKLQKVSIDFIVGDGEKIPFKINALDIVVSFAALHHLPNWRSGLREMVRTSKDKVLILEPNASSLLHLFNECLTLCRPSFNRQGTKIQWIVREPNHLNPWLLKNEINKLHIEDVTIKLMGFIPQYWPLPPLLVNTLSLVEKVLEQIPVLKYLSGSFFALIKKGS